MKKTEELCFNTVVIGSGAAGYNAACELKKMSDKSVCIITEGINDGTSRNTGSDKQTYYKLSLGGDMPDSVRKMAYDLFSGGAVDGDTALCEAALSVRCFNNLCSLGVPFPTNRYGEYIGYKTDHDPYMRATSAGPLTSKFMTEALEGQAKAMNIPVFDGLLAVEIAKHNDEVCGIICFDKSTRSMVSIICNNVILATGGPAGIYANTVYPDCHNGSTSLAINAGAHLQNLTEWQYGLASVQPKWNVSGTYMQVLPCFISVDESGNEYEFLTDYFSDMYEALSMVFLKGYQWPFDSSRAKNGSSAIDLAVYNETAVLKRRVYLDYRKNPFGLSDIDFSRLSEEAFNYLKNSDALSGTPIERLHKMNAPAIELYKSKGVDITEERLEISLSAQHNNGGISVDMWWQTNINGLFAVGECAGTHGVTRPGGSALNAGQTGSLRAAQYISQKSDTNINIPEVKAILDNIAKAHISLCKKLISDESNVLDKLGEIKKQMSLCAAAVRQTDEIRAFLQKVKDSIEAFTEQVRIKDISEMVYVYRYLDTLTVQSAVLTAIISYYETVRRTRGSAIYLDKNADSDFSISKDFNDRIQVLIPEKNGFSVIWRKVRDIPEGGDVFESIWKSYRENKNIY